MLHDIPQKDRRPIVSEIAKKLRSGGFVQLMEPTRPRHGMPVEEIRSLMSENGLKEAFSKVGKNRFEARYVIPRNSCGLSSVVDRLDRLGSASLLSQYVVIQS